MRLNNFSTNWLETYKKNAVTSNTYTRYYTIANKWILPNIGGIKLQTLKSSHIQEVYNKMKNAGLSGTSIKHAHIILFQSLKQANLDKIISSNPDENTTRPKRTKPSVSVLSIEDEKKLVEYLSNDVYGVGIKLTLNTGLRVGELLGLKWTDIDFNNKTLSVNKSLSRCVNVIGLNKYTSHLELHDVKTKSSIRIIPLLDSDLQMLEIYKQSYHLNIDNDLLFPSSRGTFMDPKNYTKRFHKILSDLNIPDIKFHALRHTFTTRALEFNIHPKHVQEILGHSSISMTLDTYSHILPNQKRNAIEQFGLAKSKL
ncbi:MAG: site-specific integrase [Bacilli bacterium]